MVGCYAHIASTVWFLGYSRWNPDVTNIPSCKFSELLLIARDAPAPESGDDDDESDNNIED